MEPFHEILSSSRLRVIESLNVVLHSPSSITSRGKLTCLYDLFSIDSILDDVSFSVLDFATETSSSCLMYFYQISCHLASFFLSCNIYFMFSCLIWLYFALCFWGSLGHPYRWTSLVVFCSPIDLSLVICWTLIKFSYLILSQMLCQLLGPPPYCNFFKLD